MRGVWRWVLVWAVALALASGNARAYFRVTAPRWTVDRLLSAFPGHALREIVVTKSPQTITITVARMTPMEYVASLSVRDEDVPLEERRIVWSGSSQPKWPHPLEHRVVLPPLKAGLYQIRLDSPQRFAVQRLIVGTLGIVANRTFRGSVLMAFDLRTFRQRRDVRLLEYFEHGHRKLFGTGPDGFIRFPYPWMGHDRIDPQAGTLIAMASDGSIVPVSDGWSLSSFEPQYFETDRSVYRPRDPLYFRLIARYADTKEGSVWIANQTGQMSTMFGWFPYRDRVADGRVFLPVAAQSAGRYDEGNIFVADTSRSRFEIEAGPLTPRVRPGENARFIISILHADGTPAIAQRFRYAWHPEWTGASFPLTMRMHDNPQDNLQYGDAVTDGNGDAVVSVPARSSGDVEIYAFDPDDGAVAASARATAKADGDTLAIKVPFGEIGPRCFPFAVEVTNDRNDPRAGMPLRIQVQRITWPTPQPPLFRKVVETSRGGFAIQRWCGRIFRNGWYQFSAQELASPNPSGSTTLSVVPSPSYNLGNTALMIAGDQPAASGKPLTVTSIGTGDGDALVLFGSGFRYASTVAHFHRGIAHFTITPPKADDDFVVSVFEVSHSTNQALTSTIRVRPHRHLLRLTVTTPKGVYTRGSSAAFRIRVRDWRGTGRKARVLVSATQTTAAGIANALSQRTVYDTLYSPQAPNADYPMWTKTSADTRVSYLYPLPSPSPRATPWRPMPESSVTPTPSPPPALFPPQTILWNNDLESDVRGETEVRIPLPHSIVPGIYVFHAIAIAKDGSVGEAYAWITVR